MREHPRLQGESSAGWQTCAAACHPHPQPLHACPPCSSQAAQRREAEKRAAAAAAQKAAKAKAAAAAHIVRPGQQPGAGGAPGRGAAAARAAVANTAHLPRLPALPPGLGQPVVHKSLVRGCWFC